MKKFLSIAMTLVLLCALCLPAVADTEPASEKIETAYVFTDAEGNVTRTLVSVWLKNASEADTLQDYSVLSDIENVKGNESFSEEEGILLWNAEGNDIYYRGNADLPLPILVKIAYTLDGENVTPEELSGKSGHVTIRYDFENETSENVLLDGNETDMPIPFVVLTALILDGNAFSNVTVENGKLINDGNRLFILGAAFPGLSESLDLDSEKYSIPSSFVIEADTDRFEIDASLAVATNALFNGIDESNLSDVDTLKDSMQKLADATQELLDGTDALFDGVGTLNEKSGEFSDGVSTLKDGTQSLADGAAELENGAQTLSDGAQTLYEGAQALDTGATELKNGAEALKDGSSELSNGVGQTKDGADTLAQGMQSAKEGADQLQAGLETLTSGLSELSANNDALTQGAAQVFDSLLEMANTQLAQAGVTLPELTKENYHEAIDSLLDGSYVEQLIETQVRATVTGNEATVTEAVTQAVREQVTQQVLSAAEGNEQADENAQALLEAAVDTQMASDEVQALIQEQVQAQIETLVQENMQSAQVKVMQEAALAQLKNSADALNDLETQLDSYNAFYTGLITYTEGVKSAMEGSSQIALGAGSLTEGLTSLKTGADALAEGLGKLQEGANSLSEGSETLWNGTVSLSEGTAELSSGAETLSSGAAQLHNGTKELSDGATELNDGAQTLKEGTEALLNGIQELLDGAETLKDGFETYKTEGIDELTKLMDEDLSELTDRVRALLDISKSYTSFSGSDENTESRVTFIYRMDSVKAD